MTLKLLQDKSSVSFPMGSSHIRCRRIICNDDYVVRCTCRGASSIHTSILYNTYMNSQLILLNSYYQQSTGAFIAVSRYASATPLPPSILSRGVGWQVTDDFPPIILQKLITYTLVFFMLPSMSSSYIGGWHFILWNIWNWDWIISFCVSFYS